MSDNINKRAVIIFPKFQNIKTIQEVRKRYDRLYGMIEPHITLIFPFSDSMADELLIELLQEKLKK